MDDWPENTSPESVQSVVSNLHSLINSIVGYDKRYWREDYAKDSIDT
jgi:hypothetical protein